MEQAREQAAQLKFCPVTTEEQIEELAEVAAQIWNEYWPPIIGQAQTDYMVGMFQSVPAISADIAPHNYRYWLLRDQQDRVVGYTGGATEQLDGDPVHDAAISHSSVVDQRWPRRFFISKIYLYASERGKHYASRVLDFYEQLCADEGLSAMYLTVNRDNQLGVRAYQGRGMSIVQSVDNPIGQGFVMTDYIFVKEIG